MFYLTHLQSVTSITGEFFHYRLLLPFVYPSQVFPSSDMNLATSQSCAECCFSATQKTSS